MLSFISSGCVVLHLSVFGGGTRGFMYSCPFLVLQKYFWAMPVLICISLFGFRDYQSFSGSASRILDLQLQQGVARVH